MADTSTASARDTEQPSKGFFGRILLFIRQVIDEIRKVVRPTREELTQYTVVVLVFLVFIMLFVVGVDWVFSRGVSWVFGDS
ncbi:preprotein translocase subunit SecE [Yimella sp. cx-51]|uniref:preprotein translocase subunit SecE n=1 Tax=Yimella sp. cx-51 TaxID=2770551 RepID=UPI00165D7F4A|nr:preprotein translocase subunit SecE [Yimella sp. cx-51]MBC9955864.1 preprotein translocase subunit SecE [Yimella sp. cx-51]QTH37590.1 preprotein translocase subunit SecE [Yimella sp. cx-51]